MEPYQKVLTDNARMIQMADAACAASNIALAAHAEGIGSCLAVSFADIAIRKILHIPEGINPQIIVTLGYPDESPEPPPRKEISEITFDDDYGKAWS
jgi:nitroreductase